MREAICSDGEYHQPPEGWMGELVACPCGHGIGKHHGYGCYGDARGSCRCHLSPHAVLANAMYVIADNPLGDTGTILDRP